MGKGKLKKWHELKSFSFVIEPDFDQVFGKDHHLKSHWGNKFFRNDHPIILELGCGKGEYTVGMARKFPEKNFLGIDIKGSRIWQGAKRVYEEKITNAGFLRTRIEFISSFFGPGEIDEIWLTFPDPQSKKRRQKKRLTSARFLNDYQSFLKPQGLLHLKTDNLELFQYTRDLLEFNGIRPDTATEDLYSQNLPDNLLEIKTYYEKQFIDQGQKITYLRFRLPGEEQLKELPLSV